MEENKRQAIERMLRTRKDITNMSLEDKADIITLHFIGCLGKPIGISDKLYNKCLESFADNRGKAQEESKAVLGVLKKYYNE